MKWENVPIEDVFICIKNGASIKQDEGLMYNVKRKCTNC